MMESSALWGIITLQTAIFLGLLTNAILTRVAITSLKDEYKTLIKLVSDLRKDNTEHMKDHTRIFEKITSIDEDIRELRQRN